MLTCFFNLVSCKKTGDEKGVFLSDPIVVAQGPTLEEAGWGPWQFPFMYKTDTNDIVVSLASGADSVEDYEAERINFVSKDNGETWNKANEDFEFGMGYCGLKMSNGKNFVGFESRNAYDASWLDAYTPKYTFATVSDLYSSLSLYYAKDIPEYSQKVIAKEYDPITKEINTFEATVNWEYMPIVRYQGRVWDNLVMPLTSWFAFAGFNSMIQLDDGTIIAVIYANGFNSETGKLSAYGDFSNVYLFASKDCGRTWDYYSQVLTTTKFSSFVLEGFCEASIEKVPDSSLIMLIRSGPVNPSYIVRSTDNGKTWTEPEGYNPTGVFPRLLSLKCGYTLASYGRPGVFFRWTDDPSGLKWNDPIDLGVTYDKVEIGKYSCGYTGMVELSDTEALLVYTDFQYPSLTDASKKVKTTLVRKITVKL